MVALDLRVSVLAVFSLLSNDPEMPTALALELGPPQVTAAALPTIPEEAHARINLDGIWWTAPHSEPVSRLADRWGVKTSDLTLLNDGLADGSAQAGQRLLVYRHQDGEVSRSVGTPNRGRMEHGIPFPEGDAWLLRDFRPRTFATAAVVTNLATALTSWSEHYPDANAVKLGEFSKRGGGRVPPHASHRAGRDVDVGYVMLEVDDGHRFVHATPSNLDGAATWGLVHRLLASGTVETIFMDASVQRILVPHAVADLEPAELEAYFSVMGSTPRARATATIRGSHGHDNHMHVRFACTEADLNCGAAKRRKKRHRRSGRGHKRR